MRPICLFTDFGVTGPYVGLMKAAIHGCQPAAPVLNLMADAPSFDPRAAAYLLAALFPYLPPGAVVLGVVDPGVGGARHPLVLELAGRFLVGPDNGLFAVVNQRFGPGRAWSIHWRPDRLSDTFHGRDLFAPVAAELAVGTSPTAAGCGDGCISVGTDWAPHLAQVIYVDHYGNAITGMAGEGLDLGRMLRVGEACLPWARTFSAVGKGQVFWYVNSIGLVEIAANGASAAQALSIGCGTPIFWEEEKLCVGEKGQGSATKLDV